MLKENDKVARNTWMREFDLKIEARNCYIKHSTHYFWKRGIDWLRAHALGAKVNASNPGSAFKS